MELLKKAETVWKQENNVITGPSLKATKQVCIFGDMRCNILDLVFFLDTYGCFEDNSDTEFLYLRDYIDKGSFGVVVPVILLQYKIMNPRLTHLLQENHVQYEVLTGQIDQRYPSQLFSDENICKMQRRIGIFEKTET